MTFWKTATTEQKLAQIDGGIECGMNSTQIAMNLGTNPARVTQFASYHRRSFEGRGFQVMGECAKRYASERLKAETEKRISARTGNLGDAAFSIFDHQPEAFELEWPA
jgi:hypothetical protein